MTEIPPQPEELAERLRRELEEQLARRRRELEEMQSKVLEQQLEEERRGLEAAMERELAEELARQSKKPLSPCPECGGQRVLFHLSSSGEGGSPGIPISGSYFPTVMLLYACACVQCGHTTLRIHPKDMEKLRKEAENE